MTGAMPPGVRENDIGGTDGSGPDVCAICDREVRDPVMGKVSALHRCHSCWEMVCGECGEFDLDSVWCGRDGCEEAG